MNSSRRKWKRTRWALVATLLIGCIAIVLLWRMLLPETKVGLSTGLSEEDRREVAEVCRDQTIWLATQKLRDGEVRNFVSLVPKLVRQRIYRFIVDQDGSVRVYVGYPLKSSTDGYGDLWRHQVVKTNGAWKVVRSY
jgi:hypothetical protein